MNDLSASYAHCRDVTRSRAKNFYYAIRMLPPERRDAMCAVYAFFRECDDLSDEGEVHQRRERLERWRQVVLGAEPAEPSPVLAAFRDANRRFGIPSKHYSDLIDGTMMDLDGYVYETFQDLYDYCYRVASTVGLVCIRIFGFDGSPEAETMAEHQGIAFQLTNILRDVAEDASMGRVYLPREILAEFGLTPEDLLAGRPGPRFGELVRHMAGRARDYYERSVPLTVRIEPRSRPALRAMAGIYRGLLEKIDRVGAGVLRGRVRLSVAEKLWVVLCSWVEWLWLSLRSRLGR